MQRFRARRSSVSGLPLAAALLAAGCGSLLGIDDVSRGSVVAGAAGASGGTGGSPEGGSAGANPAGGGGSVAGSGGSVSGGSSGVGGSGGSGVGGTGGVGGTPGPPESFVRLADFLTDDDLPVPQAFDLCTRAVPDGAWVGPLLRSAGGEPLTFLKATDHVLLPAGLYDLRALASPAEDCQGEGGAPELTLKAEQLKADEYLTVAVVGDLEGRPRLVPYFDGRPGQGAAMTGTTGGLRFEPGAITLERFRGVRTPPLAAGERRLDSVFFDGARFAPEAQVPFINGLGYSLFIVSQSLATAFIDPQGVACVNSPRETLPTVPGPSEQCVTIAFQFIDFE
ncbi:MAG: hypothetical protein MUF34_24675 [Polyangiaceae bacterium]|nr:hypothetical protein [Polyangiaceae bacterium]